MRKLITTGFLMGLLALTAMAADVTGKWTAQLPGRGGQTREATFNFKADGNTLTGTVSGRQGDMEISDGKIDGDSLSFTQTMEFNGNSMKFVYKGTISGDSIKFTRQRDGGDQPPQEFTAKRASCVVVQEYHHRVAVTDQPGGGRLSVPEAVLPRAVGGNGDEILAGFDTAVHHGPVIVIPAAETELCQRRPEFHGAQFLRQQRRVNRQHLGRLRRGGGIVGNPKSVGPFPIARNELLRAFLLSEPAAGLAVRKSADHGDHLTVPGGEILQHFAHCDRLQRRLRAFDARAHQS